MARYYSGPFGAPPVVPVVSGGGGARDLDFSQPSNVNLFPIILRVTAGDEVPSEQWHPVKAGDEVKP